MIKKKKQGKNKNSLQKFIIKIFRENPSFTYNYKQIASIIGIKDVSQRKLIVAILEKLVDDNFLKQISLGKFQLVENSSLKGTIQFIARGGGYFMSDNLEEDIFIHKSKLGKALPDDIVEIRTIYKKNKIEGEVIQIVERVRKYFVGVVEKSGHSFFFRADNKSMPVDFFIEKKHLNGAKSGEKVKIKFLSWPSSVKSPMGAIVEVLGAPGNLNVEMFSIISALGIEDKFSKEVINESENINEPNYNNEAKIRKDFRKILTFTIDPDTALDFDDALSYKELDNGNIQVGIHIADVSHYVRENTALDKEAYHRGNSVYLADRVVPMLPEKLSNGLCSLRPNEDKLTFSAVFDINNKSEIVKTWFGKTIIHSDYRLTYKQAQEIIDGKKHNILDKPIIKLNSIAEIIRTKRLEKGALNIESEELSFIINEKGLPSGVKIKISSKANKLIEEFMLLANKNVALYLGKATKTKQITPSIYRIHDNPSEEKISELKIILEQFKYFIKREKNKPISYSLNLVMQKAKENKELHIIGPLIIRSMSKAKYSQENTGHYGLSFDYYTHFTSPIRRYADLLIHRILLGALEGKRNATASYEKICQYISSMEKRAVDAERASNKMLQVLYLQDKVGEIYKGKITGVAEWGIFVEIEENKCEGLIRLNTLKDDYYSHDPETYKIIGKKTKTEYHLGQQVLIEVLAVNLSKRQIDFLMIQEDS
jgi:ribonuclease R